MAKKVTSTETPEVVPGKTKAPKIVKADVIEEAEIIEEPTALVELRQEYGLKLANEKVDLHVMTYTPYFKQLVDLETEMSQLLVKEVNAETEKEAKELRKKYSAIRIAAEKQKKADKAEINLEGGFLDKVNKRIEEGAKAKEAQCEEIETMMQKQEEARKDALKNERKQALDEYGYDTDFLNLSDMTVESFDRLLAKAKELHEAVQEKSEREQAEQAEKDRLRARKEARVKELALIGLFFNSDLGGYEGTSGFVGLGAVEGQDEENFTRTYEAIEKVYLDAKQAEEDRLAAEKEKAERITNRINAITKLGLVYNTSTETYEGYGQAITLSNVQGLEAQDFTDTFAVIKSVVDKKKADDKKAEEERNKKEEETRKENERLRKEKEAKEKAELEAKQKAEREAKAAAAAPDVDKLRALYKVLKDLSLPEMVTVEGKAALETIKQGLEIVKTGIANEAKKLL